MAFRSLVGPLRWNWSCWEHAALRLQLGFCFATWSQVTDSVVWSQGNNYCITSFWRGWSLGKSKHAELVKKSEGYEDWLDSRHPYGIQQCNKNEGAEIVCCKHWMCTKRAFPRHVSFNRWLIRYLYIPLGGRKCSDCIWLHIFWNFCYRQTKPPFFTNFEVPPDKCLAGLWLRCNMADFHLPWSACLCYVKPCTFRIVLAMNPKALWHDAELKLFAWGMLNAVFMATWRR